MFSRIAAAFFGLLVLCASANAQTGTAKSITSLQAEIGTNLPDNTIGFITPFLTRQTLLDVATSAVNSVNPGLAIGIPIVGGNLGQCLYDNGGVLGTTGCGGGGSGNPGGSNTQVQFNSSNAFAGDAGFTYFGNGAAFLGAVGTGTGSLGFVGNTGTAGGVVVQATTNSNNYNLVLPGTVGTNGFVLGSTVVGGTASLGWVSPSITVNSTTCTLAGSCTVPAAAGTLTGAALANNVVTSSLTSVGTIGTGIWQGTAIGLSFIASISADNLLGNPTGSTAAPQATPLVNCTGADSALLYSTSTHLFSCNSVAAPAGTLTGTTLASNVVTSSLTSVGTISSGTWAGTAIGLTHIASISADNVLGNPTGSSAAPQGMALPSCSGAANALLYNTSTHAFGCNSINGSGTVSNGTAVGQLAYYPAATNVVNGAVDAIISNGNLTLGLANTTIGEVILEGSTSGAVTLTPQATAGTPTITFGTSSGTPAVTASSPLVITTATGNITCPTCATNTSGGAFTGTTPVSVSGNAISITGVAGEVLAGSGPAFTATPTLGVASSTTGKVLFVGTTSGTVTFSVADAAGTWTMKLPTTSGSAGNFLETDGSGNTTWASPTGSGTVNSGTMGQLAWYAANGTTVSGNTNATISAGALTLGSSGTAGDLILNGATSGTTTITPQAIASGTLSLPAVTDTVAVLGTSQTFTATQTFSGTLNASGTFQSGGNTMTFPGSAATLAGLGIAETWTAAQTFTNSDILLLGSSTGATTFTSANSGASNFTATVPANTGTIAELNLAQTWTAAQTFTNSDFLLLGSSTGATTFTSANAGASNFTLTFPAITDTVVTLTATQTLTNKSISGSEINSGTVAFANLSPFVQAMTAAAGHALAGAI